MVQQIECEDDAYFEDESVTLYSDITAAAASEVWSR
jgi:hypothetical protein